MFYLQGKVMEIRSFKTKKGVDVPVYGIWVQNGKRSFSYDVLDFDGHLNGAKVDDQVKLPIAIQANAADKNVRAFLNISAAGKMLSGTVK